MIWSSTYTLSEGHLSAACHHLVHQGEALNPFHTSDHHTWKKQLLNKNHYTHASTYKELNIVYFNTKDLSNTNIFRNSIFAAIDQFYFGPLIWIWTQAACLQTQWSVKTLVDVYIIPTPPHPTPTPLSTISSESLQLRCTISSNFKTLRLIKAWISCLSVLEQRSIRSPHKKYNSKK